MQRNDIEKHNILQRSAEILNAHPELLGMGLPDILNELDDGSSEMMHIRWGVAARVIVEPLTDMSPKALVSALVQHKSRGLICEYVGYLLLTECSVSLVDLLVESDRQGLFDEIAPYVTSNLQYEVSLSDKQIAQVLVLLNMHTDSKEYSPLIFSCADYVERMSNYQAITNSLGDLDGQAQCDFMRRICWPWYKNSPQEASVVTRNLLSYKSQWSKRAAIAFLEASLYHGQLDFSNYYSQVEEAVSANNELWLNAIPLFIQYVLKRASDENDGVREAVLRRLETIPDGELEEKCSFIRALQQEEQQSEDIENLFQEILLRPIQQDQHFLDMLNTCFEFRVWRQVETWESILQMLLTVFSVNQYDKDYNQFFETFSGTIHELNKDQTNVTITALRYLLNGDEHQLFFGLGLLSHIGNISKMHEEMLSLGLETSMMLTENQLIRIMKTVLYFSFDSMFVCSTAFHLLNLSKQENTEYLKFCLSEIFANYPGTMNKLAEQFCATGSQMQTRLANQVIQKYQESHDAYAVGRTIKDIYPVQEHLLIWRRAQAKVMDRAKEANEGSFFFEQLFSKRVLKYGGRMAHVVHGAKDELFYQVGSPTQISHEMELPYAGSQDPVHFAIKRSAFLKEVRESAAGNQRLFAPTQGEERT